MSWLYHAADRGHDRVHREEVREARPEIAEANVKAFKAGWAYGETSRGLRDAATRSRRPSCRPAPTGTSRATRRSRWGSSRRACSRSCRCSWAPTRSRRPRRSSTTSRGTRTSASGRSRPRTRSRPSAPRSARASAARSASARRAGRAIVLKKETIGLAVTLELPLLILDIQRAGPSTGMPTKPEQADLLMAMFGRNAESPVPVVAASTPGGCFDAAIEAARIALKYRTPVFLLSDAYLANGSEPWLMPDVESLPDISVEFADQANHEGAFMPYQRDPETLGAAMGDPRHAGSRAPDRRAREGGRDRQRLLRPGQPRPHGSPARAEGGRDRGRHPGARGRRPGRRATVLVLGWGGTYGPIAAAVRRVRTRRQESRMRT